MKTVDEVLTINTLLGLRTLRPADFDGRWVTTAEIQHFLKLTEAGWFHSGDPSRPHVVMQAGEHSDGFIDTLGMLRHTNLCLILGQQMARMITIAFPDLNLNPLDWCIGSDHAATAFSHTVATALNLQHDSPRKAPAPDKGQFWERYPILPGQRVLQVEELMTTAETLLRVLQGIRNGNRGPVEFLPVGGVLIHRSDVDKVEETKIVSFFHFDINKWTPEECPLCREGSKAIVKPKLHWAELTGKG